MNFKFGVRSKCGADLNIKGKALLKISSPPRCVTYAIKPSDFFLLNSKLFVKEGTKVKKGTPLFYDKLCPEIKFVAPVSGTVTQVKRGKRRKVLQLAIESDRTDDSEEFKIPNINTASREDVIDILLESGSWPYLSQRPYGIVANPKVKPKALFVSIVDKRPLGVDNDFILKDRIDEFQKGVEVLNVLCENIYMGFPNKYNGVLKNIKGIIPYSISGSHPVGNLSVHINKIRPLNTGEHIWTIHPEDVINIGNLFFTGQFSAQRTVAVAGNSVTDPQYFRVTIGHEILPLLHGAKVKMNQINRFVNGDLLSGDFVDDEDHIGYYNNLVCVVPEGNEYRTFGWLPFKHNHLLSLSRTSFNWLLRKGNRNFEVDTNLNGEERALVVTGEMEKVFPMDIFPLQLIKACMVEDIEKMEALGIFEVVPEDFGLIDFSNSSKLEAQQIIKEALELMYKEVG